jgi:hypothetical protein
MYRCCSPDSAPQQCPATMSPSVSAFINSTDTACIFKSLVNVRYWYVLCPRKFNTSLLFKTHITIPRHFTTPGNARENLLFHGVELASGTVRISHKKWQKFPVYFDWSLEDVTSQADCWEWEVLLCMKNVNTDVEGVSCLVYQSTVA